jgi:hypothetical protein
MKKILETVGILGGTVGVISALLAVTLGVILIGPILFMICWNYVASMFWSGAPDLNFLQALAVVILARMVFKSSVTVTNKKE